jgi:lysophospholipase L1-like esterase
MHYKILLGQPQIWNERQGTLALNLREYASKGSSTLKLTSSASLVRQQLISYRGRDGQYYSAQVQSISNNNVQLSTPLQQDVFAGGNAWDFYDDGSHPTWVGSRVIADFSIRYLGYNRLNQGKHVLLGDSWFSRQSVFLRLKERLPAANIINKGVGGHTAADLLARFNADVTWQNPDYVWIMTGTNDYWKNVSASTYKSNMRSLINKVRAIGAVPVVYDSSVGPLNYGSDAKTRLSRSYVSSVDQLLGEY